MSVLHMVVCLRDTHFNTQKSWSQALKTELLVKATAELAQEVLDKDLTATEKNLGEIVSEITNDSNRRTIHGSVPKSGGKNKKKV